MAVETGTRDFHASVRSGDRILSYSQIATFMACPERWWLVYVLGLHAKKPADPLALGDAVHQALAGYLANETPVEETVLAWTAQHLASLPGLDSIIESADRLGTNAIEVAQTALAALDDAGLSTAYVSLKREGVSLESDAPSGSVVAPAGSAPSPVYSPAVEMELTADLPGTVFDHFAGHLDWVAIDRSSRLWLVDFKIRKQFSQPAYEQTNLQHLIYSALCHAHDIPIFGTMTVEVRAEMAQKPSLNKDGSMSRAKIATTWKRYREALLDAGLDPADYLDMANKLDVPFVNIMKEHRSVDVIAAVWGEIVEPIAHQISELYRIADKGVKPWQAIRYLNSRTCSWCGVRDVCLAGLYGTDPAPLLELFDYNESKMRQAIRLNAV